MLGNKAIQRNTFSGRAINDIRFSKQRLDLSSTSDRHSELVKGWSKKASVQMLYGKDAGYWDGENLVAQLKDIAIRALKKPIQDGNCYSSSNSSGLSVSALSAVKKATKLSLSGEENIRRTYT